MNKNQELTNYQQNEEVTNYQSNSQTPTDETPSANRGGDTLGQASDPLPASSRPLRGHGLHAEGIKP